MRITRQQLEQMKPHPNWVLVKQLRHNDRVSFGADARGNPVLSHIDTTFEPMKHAGVVGIVQAVPDSLVYQAGMGDTMEWDTDMELLPGDTVWFSYLDATAPWEKTSLRYNSYWECEGEMYILVHYSRCFVAKRWLDANSFDGEGSSWPLQDEVGATAQNLVPDLEALRVTCTPQRAVDMYRQHGQIIWHSPKKKGCFRIIPLNGYVLAEPMKEELGLAELGLDAPQMLANKASLTYARAKYIGSCIREYGFGKTSNSPDSNDLHAGDVFVMDRYCDIPLEYSLHASFSGNELLYRVQRRYIFGVLEK